ncbi:MAG TPA: hypothetical protein VLF68_01675 [Candidatus Saccharimonadales bacterium]|nr:hypothetical protein [Candidatus Saccharimonadales bacterium]
MKAENIQLLTSNIVTKKQAVKFLAEIEMLTALLYQTNKETVEKTLHENVREATRQLCDELLKNEAITWSDHEKVALLFAAVRDFVKKQKVLQVTLGFEPSEQTFSLLLAWAHKNLDTNVIIDVSYDEALLGGANIVFEGKYASFTLSNMLTDIFETHKDEIKKLIQPPAIPGQIQHVQTQTL